MSRRLNLLGWPGVPRNRVNNKIDFVITWVNGEDEEWQKSKNSYVSTKAENASHMYRDWDNLRYWFRGVEKFTPWVNKIHFVTCGHLPEWLNTDHPKLNVVKHSDYMPEEYLPTFNSLAIELNFHRINGLEEQFVYFNDDMFVMDYMQPTDFFKNNLPCDSGIMASLLPSVPNDPFFHYLINDLAIINHNFSKREVLKRDWSKWISLKYGKLLLKNIYYAPIKMFTGFLNLHLAASFLKSTFNEVWDKEPEVLNATSLNKFRTIHDDSPYVISYWQFATGKYFPRRTDWGRFFVLGEDDQQLIQIMSSKKYKMICINDSVSEKNFNAKKEAIKKQFNQLLPEKSSFEL